MDGILWEILLYHRSKYIKKNSMIYLFRILGFGVTSMFIMCCQNSTSQYNDGELITEDQENHWTRIGPGGGGSTFIPTFSYSSPDRFMLRCDMTGAYLTDDGGLSYDLVNFPGGSHSFAYDPSDPKTILIGSKALNKSSDGGKTWERIFPAKQDVKKELFEGDHADYNILTNEESLYQETGRSKTVRNVKVDPIDPKTIYFSINNYFFHTSDDGVTWSSISFEQNIDFIYTDSLEDGEVYVFTSNGIFVVDKTTWEYSFDVFPEQMQPGFSFTGGTIKENGHTVFYGLNNDESLRIHGGIAPSTLWISRDFGKSWEQALDAVLMNSENTIPTYSKISAAENDAANVYSVTSSYQEKRENGTIAHWYGTLKSDDAGRSWHWVWKGGGGSGKYAVKDGEDATNLTDAWVREAFGGEYIRLIDVGVAPNNGKVAVVTDWYRTMKTIDGGKTWEEIYSVKQPDGSYISRGLDVTTAYGVHFDPFDREHVAISYTDIGYHHSYNGGKSWYRSTSGIPPNWHNTCYWMVFDPEVKDKIWSVWSGLHDFPRGKMTRNPQWTEYGKGGVAVSLDGGKSWTPTVDGMGFNTPSISIVLDENSPVDNRTLYVAAYGKGVYKSTDDGKSWELQNKGITGSLAAFELTIQPDGTLFLITSATPQHINGEKGREVHMGAVYKSTDGADSWIKINVGGKVLFPNGLAFDPDDPDRLYLGAWADIHLSDLIGGDWARETGGNETLDLDGGIFLSEDKGDTWEQIFDADHYVYDVTVDPNDPDRVYCNTFDQGAYRSDDAGKSWGRIKGYDFHWGHRVIVDEHNPDNTYLITYGSSVWHGKPVTEPAEVQ